MSKIEGAIAEILDRLDFLFAIAHSDQWLLAKFADVAAEMDVSPSLVWHLWHTYQAWGQR